jgi:RNA polymerase sigma factor (sigma-70 family)
MSIATVTSPSTTASPQVEGPSAAERRVTVCGPRLVPAAGPKPATAARASVVSATDEVRVGTLVQSARAGDAGAWRALVDRYSPMLWNIARGFRLDHATCADVVQTTWVALAENLHSVREPDAVGGWLASTARRAALREVCRRKRVDLWGEFTDRDMVDPAPAPDEWAATRDRDDRLRRAFRRLPERDQRLLTLLWAAPPRPYAEIAEILGIPIGSIGPTRARALARLRAELVGEGIDHPSAVAV